MIIEALPVGLLGANCIILGDASSRLAVVVDPGGDVPRILTRLADLDLRAQAILLTHGHVDHVGGAGELKRVTGAAVYLNERDRSIFEKASMQAARFGMPAPEPCSVDCGLEDGSKIALGDKTIITMHTPGHSPGSVSFWIEEECLCIAGDTLFAGGVGRTDLWGGDFESLERSIRERLYTLEPATRVIPGHGPSTSIGQERSHNPFVRMVD